MKRYLSKEGVSYQWLYFGTKIPLDHIRKRGDQNILKTIRKISGSKKDFNLRDLIILPPSYMHGLEDDLLFVLNYRGNKIDIHLNDIEDKDEIFKLNAWNEKEHMLKTLQKGEWCLHVSDDGQSGYITVYGRRYGYVNVPMLGFSMYDIIPNDIMDDVRKNKWRIAIDNPDRALSNLKGMHNQSEVYVDKRCASLLMEIPLACYSVVTGDRVKTIKIDIRDLRNVYFPSTFGRKVRHRQNAVPCISPQDLFDAMLYYGRLWYFDKNNDLLYLPHLPRLIGQSGMKLVEVSHDHLKEEDILLRKTIISLLHHLPHDSQRYILSEALPLSRCKDDKVLITEMIKRVEASGWGDTFKAGSCFMAGKKMLCMLPTPPMLV